MESIQQNQGFGAKGISPELEGVPRRRNRVFWVCIAVPFYGNSHIIHLKRTVVFVGPPSFGLLVCLEHGQAYVECGVRL